MLLTFDRSLRQTYDNHWHVIWISNVTNFSFLFYQPMPYFHTNVYLNVNTSCLDKFILVDCCDLTCKLFISLSYSKQFVNIKLFRNHKQQHKITNNCFTFHCVIKHANVGRLSHDFYFICRVLIENVCLYSSFYISYIIFTISYGFSDIIIEKGLPSSQ